MQLYLLVATADESDTAEAVRTNFEERLVYQISPFSWIIAGSGTASEIWYKLEKEEGDDASNNTLVVRFSDYFGYLPLDVWNWIDARVKESANGGSTKTA